MGEGMNKVITSGIIATVEDALQDPDSYMVSHGMLGWTLRHIASNFSTLIQQDQALQLIKMQQRMQPETLPKLYKLLK
jgi:hypothetical protein